MKPIAFIVVSAMITISCSTPQSSESNSNSPLKVYADSLFTAEIDSANIAGAAVALIKNGESLLTTTYGLADLEYDIPMPLEASFEIGSVTKQFTAVAILKLRKEGKLKLEDDITEYLEFDTQGRNVTVGQLLNHTSGIASYTEMPEFWPLSVQRHERDTLLRLVEKAGFLFEPGEALIYNNSAYFMLGLIIEKVSEQSYEDYLAENLFQPLGMSNSYYCDSRLVRKNRAHGYNYAPNGLTRKPYIDHTWPYAAGSLCSTVADLALWIQALHGGKVLDEEDYKLLVTPGVLNDGSQLRYAMGLDHHMDRGNRMIGHGGGIHGFLSETRYYPDQDLIAIILLNTAGPTGPGTLADLLTEQILETSEPTGLEADYSGLMNIAGAYSGAARGEQLNVTVQLGGNSLIIKRGAEPADTLTTYVGDNTWQDGNTLISFTGETTPVMHIDQVYGHYVLTKE